MLYCVSANKIVSDFGLTFTAADVYFLGFHMLVCGVLTLWASMLSRPECTLEQDWLYNTLALHIQELVLRLIQ